jgi:hypothetical protein
LQRVDHGLRVLPLHRRGTGGRTMNGRESGYCKPYHFHLSSPHFQGPKLSFAKSAVNGPKIVAAAGALA